MRNKQILLLWAFLCLVVSTVGAQSFLHQRTHLYEQSSQTWICQEFERSNPAFFQQKTLQVITAPDAGLDSLFPGMCEPFTSEEQILFGTSLSIPRLVLHQKALCDFYSPLIERKLLLTQLPLSYKYLPAILTGFNASFENDRDQAGIWAMSYPIARQYKLRVDSLIDERRGGDIATSAAIEHLKSLHLKYQGNMNNVLIAYWKSPAYVQAMIDQQRDFAADDKEFIRYYLYLSTYLHRLPVRNALEDYFDVYANYGTHFFTRSTSFRSIELVLGCNKEQLRSINPAYVGNKLDSSYRRISFLLPLKEGEYFQRAPDSLYNFKERPVVIDVVDEYIVHKVKKGESLGTIAKKYRVSVNQIKQWNNLRRNTIRAGQNLRIRQHKRVVKPDVPKPKADLPPTSIQLPQDTLKIDTVRPKPSLPKPKQAEPKAVVHTVKNGENLWLIAKKYKTTPEKIMALNKCGENIRPGQKLKIPGKK
ncbi:MAG: Membrane-bound lytic murein transglycosylase precursor [Bacteroidota bacterium]